MPLVLQMPVPPVVRVWLLHRGVTTFEECQCLPSIAKLMHEACWLGELEVCKYMHNAIGKRVVHVESSSGATPFFVCCYGGHVHLAEWLIDVGANIRQPNALKETPLFVASCRGFLRLVKWLVAHGAAEDTNTTTDYGSSPVRIAVSCRHFELACYLMVQGSVEPFGGINEVLVVQCTSFSSELKGFLLRLVNSAVLHHATFSRLILPAVCLTTSPAAGLIKCQKKTQLTCTAPLARLRGHEGTILVEIADFAGISRGRGLRNMLRVRRLLEGF